MDLRLARHTELDRDLELKLDRAHTHLDKLRVSIDEWRAKNLYRFDTHREREGRDGIGAIWHTTWDVTQLSPFPDDWTILAGEVLYQLHSSLDHLAWELANTKAFPKEPDRVTFPICTSRRNGTNAFWRRNSAGGFRQGSGGWTLQRVPGWARLPILNVQPYKRGDRAPDDPLWHLFLLSNEDKHRALHVASSAVTKQHFEGLVLEDVEFVGSGINRHNPFDGTAREVFWHRVRVIGDKPKLSGKANFMILPVFGEGSPKPILGSNFFETLRAIYNHVVVDVLKGQFLPLVG